MHGFGKNPYDSIKAADTVLTVRIPDDVLAVRLPQQVGREC